MRSRILAVAAVLALGGCGFLESSGPEGGVSPFVSDFRVSPSTVSCGRDFALAFSFSDPQNDIEYMRVTYLHESGLTFEEEVLWSHGGGLFGLEELTEEELAELEELGLLEEPGFLNLSDPERAVYTTSFECDTGKPRGAYTVTIILVDDNGHESSPRSDTLSLSTS